MATLWCLSNILCVTFVYMLCIFLVRAMQYCANDTEMKNCTINCTHFGDLPVLPKSPCKFFTYYFLYLCKLKIKVKLLLIHVVYQKDKKAECIFTILNNTTELSQVGCSCSVHVYLDSESIIIVQFCQHYQCCLPFKTTYCPLMIYLPLPAKNIYIYLTARKGLPIVNEGIFPNFGLCLGST